MNISWIRVSENVELGTCAIHVRDKSECWNSAQQSKVDNDDVGYLTFLVFLLSVLSRYVCVCVCVCKRAFCACNQRELDEYRAQYVNICPLFSFDIF